MIMTAPTAHCTANTVLNDDSAIFGTNVLIMPSATPWEKTVKRTRPDWIGERSLNGATCGDSQYCARFQYDSAGLTSDA